VRAFCDSNGDGKGDLQVRKKKKKNNLWLLIEIAIITTTI